MIEVLEKPAAGPVIRLHEGDNVLIARSNIEIGAKVTDGMARKAAGGANEGGAAVGATVDAMKSIANKIGIIEKGQLLFNGDVAEAIRQVRQNPVVRVGVADGRDREAADLLEKHPAVLSVEPCNDPPCLRVTLAPGTIDPGPLADALMGAGFRLRLLMEEEIDLEDVFLGITKGITS